MNVQNRSMSEPQFSSINITLHIRRKINFVISNFRKYPKISKGEGGYRCKCRRQHHPRRIGRYFREKEALRSPYPLKFQQKRRNGSDRSLPSVWRRTWDSNPRGCYTLLDFQSSSLATRSILQVYAAQRHLYYYSISGPALQAKFRQSCIFSFRKATFFLTVFCSLLFQAFHSVFTLYE